MDVDSLNQSCDDFMYVMLDHIEMYSQFDVFHDSIFHFIDNGKFQEISKREPFLNELVK